MSLIKPSSVEYLFYKFYHLEEDRPLHYNLVFFFSRQIFKALGEYKLIEEFDNMVTTLVEKPLNAKLFAILKAYYNPRFFFSKKAYCKIGSGIDTIEITRYEMEEVFEYIKNWCSEKVNELSQYVRFTMPSQMYQ